MGADNNKKNLHLYIGVNKYEPISARIISIIYTGWPALVSMGEELMQPLRSKILHLIGIIFMPIYKE